MPRLRPYRITMLTGAAVLALTTSASAQVVTRFATYMHSGPGREFAVTDEIPTRTPLMSEPCQAGWCRITYGGVQGWVQQSMLTSAPTTAQPRPGERPVECMDYARTGWPNAGNLERVCIFAPVKPAG